MHELQAVLGLVSNSLGGDEASARLGALLRKLRGSREQIASLLRDRNDSDVVDVGVWL